MSSHVTVQPIHDCLSNYTQPNYFVIKHPILYSLHTTHECILDITYYIQYYMEWDLDLFSVLAMADGDEYICPKDLQILEDSEKSSS